MFCGFGYVINFQQHCRLNHKQEAVNGWVVGLPVRHMCFVLLQFLQFFISPPKSFLREETRHQNSVPAQQVSHLESVVSQLHSELREAKRVCEDKVHVESCVSASASETGYEDSWKVLDS